MTSIKPKYLKRLNKMNVKPGKTAVLTGGNSGIGFAVAQYLVALSWKVILAVRSLSRGEEAKKALLDLAPEASVEVYELDLSKKESVLAFAARLKEERLDIDVFYANAGIYRMPFSLPYDGIESHMAVNCLSNLLLYRKLKDYFCTLPHQVKFILTSSVVARNAKLAPEDWKGERRYSPMRAYAKSKLAVNALYRKLVDECKDTNILPLLVHPGITNTPLIAKAYSGKVFRFATQRFLRLFFHRPEKAALCTMYLLGENISFPTFAAPRGLFHASGYPKEIRLYGKNLRFDVEAYLFSHLLD